MDGQTCTWSPEYDGADEWATGCGNEFMLMDAGPVEMGFKFCPFCGMALIEAPDPAEA